MDRGALGAGALAVDIVALENRSRFGTKIAGAVPVFSVELAWTYKYSFSPL